MGIGRYLKEKKPGVKIVGVEPSEGHTIQGLKNMNESIVPRSMTQGSWMKRLSLGMVRPLK